MGIKKIKVNGEKLSMGAISAIVIASVLVFNIILYILVQTFSLYLYGKEEIDFSISGAMDSVFEKAEYEGKKVKISFCQAEDELKSSDVGSYVYNTAKEYEKRYSDTVELDYLNIITRRDKDGNLVDLSKFETDMQGQKTLINKYSVIFECGNNYRVVTDSHTTGGYVDFFTLDKENYVTSYNGEEVMAGMICWVLADEHKKACFTQKHGEIADVALSNLLACAGYFVEFVDLKKEKTVPEGTDLLVISNPSADFEQGASVDSEIEKIESYLESGGNLFVSVDPYVKKLNVLESFLSKWGIAFSTTSSERGEIKNILKDSYNAITTDGFTVIAEYADSPLASLMKSKTEAVSDGGIILSTVAALRLSGEAMPLLYSSPSSELYADGSAVDSEGSYCISAYAEKDFDGKKGTVFVIPSVYLAVSDTLVSREYSNKEFLYALFDEFYGAEDMPYGCRAILTDTTTLENLKLGTARLYTAMIMAIPVALAVVGAVVIIKRKHR
jgi:hypothetical protein